MFCQRFTEKRSCHLRDRDPLGEGWWGRGITSRVFFGLILWGTVLCACGSDEEGSPEPTEPTPFSGDRDGDLILDTHEGAGDPDSDGVPNYLDLDSDGDGVPDRVEAGDQDLETHPRDSDGDGLEDYLDEDSDNNGSPDSEEVGLNPSQPLDFDGDGLADYIDPDNDGDFIADSREIQGAYAPDTDGDGWLDYYDSDSDDDGISDRDESGLEAVGESPVDTDGDGRSDYRDQDSDGDGLSDTLEAGDSDPATAPRDTDRDGRADFQDLDSDGDSVSDKDEATGVSDPILYDTDGDGASDGVERWAQSDPLNASSYPGRPFIEVPQRARVSASYTFTLSIGRADVVFILDNTGSMSSSIAYLASSFDDVVHEVQQAIPDTSFGVGSLQDYAGAAYGGSGVLPFRLEQQVTSEPTDVVAALNALRGGGGTGPTAALEALYQALLGEGFDQGCDGAYDSGSDVPPFLTRTDDAFCGGASGVCNLSGGAIGVLGGMGYRSYGLPILVYATDVDPREPAEGDPVPASCLPPCASSPAGQDAVVEASLMMGARLIGVNASGSSDLQSTMIELAERTGSMVDLDDDGVADDPLVFGMADVTSLPSIISKGVSSIVTTGSFIQVTLQADGDPHQFFYSSKPDAWYYVQPGQTVEFEVTYQGAEAAVEDDQLFDVHLGAYGDGATRLSVVDVIVVVPGERAP